MEWIKTRELIQKVKDSFGFTVGSDLLDCAKEAREEIDRSGWKHVADELPEIDERIEIKFSKDITYLGDGLFQIGYDSDGVVLDCDFIDSWRLPNP